MFRRVMCSETLMWAVRVITWTAIALTPLALFATIFIWSALNQANALMVLIGMGALAAALGIIRAMNVIDHGVRGER